MKKTLISILAISLFITIKAQLVVLDPLHISNDLNNATIDVQGLSTDFVLEQFLWIANNDSNTLTLKCKKIEMDMLTGTENIACWVVCPANYEPAGSNPTSFVTVGGVQMTETVGSGDTILSFSSHYKPMSLDGCSMIRYEWYDENNLNNALAGVNIRFIHTTGTCSADINEDLDFSSFNIFPNPAKESVAISLDENIQSNDLNVDIYDIIGKKVYSSKFRSLNSNKVNIDVKEFKQGVYIITLSKNGHSLKTRRLIVEH